MSMAATNNSTTAIVTACIAAGVTLAVGIVSLLSAYLANKRDRRRTLYSEAFKAAVSWKEMLYRVRRRETGQERELIDGFHALQDQLSYYVGWIGSESRVMKKSYDHLVKQVKVRTEPLITQAWGEPPRSAPGNAAPADVHPDLTDLTNNFLADVRSHLSPWPWRKVAVRWRNRKRT